MKTNIKVFKPEMPIFPSSKPEKNIMAFVNLGIIIIIFLIVAFLFLVISTSFTGSCEIIDTGYLHIGT